jgi:hypothetical protein
VVIDDFKHQHDHRRHSPLGYQGQPTTMPSVPTNERLSFAVNQFTGSGHLLTDADTNVLSAAQPWREFRWCAGQKHCPGTYWSATEGRYVSYESRLELARLLFGTSSDGAPNLCAPVRWRIDPTDVAATLWVGQERS